jgi:hypothetical protein
LHFIGLKNSLIGWTQNPDRFRSQGLREGDHLSESNK